MTKNHKVTLPARNASSVGRLQVKGNKDPQEGAQKNWLNPINKTLLVVALKSKKEHITLDGREFTISYSKREGYAWVEPKGPEFAPCGWFELSRSTSRDFFNG